jgi:uncharacterized tellurite resistance protein B-like protein
MDAKELLYYGFGQVVYAMAAADGEIQKEEWLKLQEILQEAHNRKEIEMDVTGIIFKLQQNQQTFSSTESLEMGLKNMRLGDHHLTPELYDDFLRVLGKIANAFPPSTADELRVMEIFESTFSFN